MFLRKSNRGTELQKWATEQLVAAFQQSGEQHYFSELFYRHLHLVYYSCNKFLQDREMVRDITMQVFAKAYSQLGKTDIRSFSNWLYTLTKHECINYIRNREKQIVSTSLQIEEQAEPYDHLQVYNEAELLLDGEDADQTEAIVREALTRLDYAQRSSLELFYFEQKSYKEIATMMSLSEGQVKSMLQNGKRRMRQILEPIFLGRDNKWP